MKRATITLPPEMEDALERYIRDQEVTPTFTAIVQAALREYLAGRGYLGEPRFLRIRPAEQGSGSTDVSLNHDRYFAER